MQITDITNRISIKTLYVESQKQHALIPGLKVRTQIQGGALKNSEESGVASSYDPLYFKKETEIK